MKTGWTGGVAGVELVDLPVADFNGAFLCRKVSESNIKKSRGNRGSYIGYDGILSDATDRSLDILLDKSAISS